MMASSPEQTIASVLVAKRYDVLEALVQRVRRVELAKATVSAADIARPLAACLTWMSRTLAGLHADPMECARLAYDYADDRKRMGYELSDVLTELGLFRSAIAEVAANAGIRDPREVDRASALVHCILVDAAQRATTKSGSATLRMAAMRRSRG